MDTEKSIQALQLVAREAISLAAKLTSKQYSQALLQEYQKKRSNNATRIDIQQHICDIKINLDEAINAMEKLGFDNLLARYNE